MRLSTRGRFLALTLIPAGLLAAGLALGEWARLQACYLCNFQRFVYLVLVGWAALGVLLPGGRRFWGALYGLTAAGGAATALYQSWMQYAPQQALECGFGDPTLIERLVNWLSLQWPTMFMVTGFCTSKEWVFMGLSLANWSAVCFLALAAAGMWVRRRL